MTHFLDHILDATIGADTQYKNLQTGEITISAGNTSATEVFMTPLTLDKSLLFFNYSHSYTLFNANSSNVRGRLSSTTQLKFSRAATLGNVYIRWFILEFKASSGIVVQRGTKLLTGTTTDVTISSSTLTNSFPVISWQSYGGLYSSPHIVSAELTSATNLRLTTYATDTHYVDWQVIYNPLWTVAKYTGALTGTTLNTTITAINLSEAMLISSAAASNSTTISGTKIPYAYFSSATNILATRTDSSLNLDMIYHVITSSRFRNLHYQYNISAGNTTATQTTSSFTVANAILIMTGMSVCDALTSSSTSNADDLKIKHKINSATQIQADKIGSAFGANFAVSVIDFSGV